MANTFQVVTQYPGVQAIGGTQVQDVTFVGITTKPHGTYIEFPVLQSAYSVEVVNAAALGWADIVESVWAEPNVAGVEWTQVVNTSNQLVSSLTITVSSASGNSAGQLTVAISQLGPGLHKAQIEALSEQLDAAEAL